MAKRIMVTGTKGYIGCVLVPRLIEAGHQVVGVDIDLYHDADFRAPEALFGDGHGQFEHRVLDVRDMRASDLRGIDCVMHLAALSNDPLGNLDSELTLDINYRATIQLAKFAKEAGVGRFLFSSSCSSYGAAGDELLDEQADLNPVTPYGESKVLADRELASLASDDFVTVSLRNATAYGASPRLRLDLVVNDFAAAAYLHGSIKILSDGTPWRPLVHVDDIASAFLAFADAPAEQINGQSFNVGDSRENYRVSELATLVAKKIPGCEIQYAAGGGPDKRCYRVNCDKLRQCLPNFKTKWTVEAGVDDLLHQFRTYGLDAADVDNRRFHRLSSLKRRQDEGVVDSSFRRST